MKRLLILLCPISMLQIKLNAQQLVTKEWARPVAIGVVNMKELSDHNALLPRPIGATAGILPNETDENSYHEPYAPPAAEPDHVNLLHRTAVSSPSAIFTYEGEKDEAQGGGASGS